MTVQEMHNEFRIRYDNIASFSNPEYSPEEIDTFLNTAQQALIMFVKKQGAERNQTYRDFLANITENFSTSAFITNADNHPNGQFVVLPLDYRTALEERVDITYTDCNSTSQTTQIEVKPTTHDRLSKDVKNPFKKPKKDGHVLSVPFGRLSATPDQQTVELIGSTDFTIDTYYLRYYRNPLTIQYGSVYATPLADQDCELNEEAQDWIIERAVQTAFDSSAQLSRFQVSKQIENLDNNGFNN